MNSYTIHDPFGLCATVQAVGIESAKELGRHEMNLHPPWPVTVARYPEPPGLRTKIKLMRVARIEPQRIVEIGEPS